MKRKTIEPKIRDIVYEIGDLSEKTSITDTIGMHQRILIKGNVIYNWKLEEVVEGIYTIELKFHVPKRKTNFLGNYARYQVQRNANETAVLVRVSE